jgi:TPR repeat protein
MNEAIGDMLAADDLRIRREWNAGRPVAPKAVTNPAEQLHIRAHRQWDAGKLRGAFRLMLSAAKLGDSAAMSNLGYFYDEGIGVKRNRAAAMQWYRKAYRRGDHAGASNIGLIYRMENKPRRALRWFEKAVALGDIDANLEIAQVYIKDLEQPQAAKPYLETVAAGKPRVDVTEASWEEARLLLKGL